MKTGGTYIQIDGIPAGGSSGFHPIGINGGPSRPMKLVRDIATGCGRNSGNKTMLKIMKNLKASKSGASAAEYALIIAVLGGFVVGGATLFGGQLRETMEDTGQSLNATDNGGTAFTNPA